MISYYVHSTLPPHCTKEKTLPPHFERMIHLIESFVNYNL